MLVGRKVILRTFRDKDMEKLYDLAADVRDMGDYWPLSLVSEPKWKKQFQETGNWEGDHGVLLITDHEDAILGHVVFFKAASYMNAFELGYRIYKPGHWGQGYMSEAVSLFVAFLFETKPVDRIQATTLLDNEGSQKVLEKCGFQFEAILRKAIFHQGQSQDLRLYALLRQDSPALKDLLAQ